MIQKDGVYMIGPVTVTCDGRCDKAWGMNGRPTKYFGDAEKEPDDYVYLPDDELGKAPFPGTAEGGHMRPSNAPVTDGQIMNKWCARECERSRVQRQGTLLTIPNMKAPVPNLHKRHPRRKQLDKIQQVIADHAAGDVTKDERNALLAIHLLRNLEDWPILSEAMAYEDQCEFTEWFESLKPGTQLFYQDKTYEVSR